MSDWSKKIIIPFSRKEHREDKSVAAHERFIKERAKNVGTTRAEIVKDAELREELELRQYNEQYYKEDDDDEQC